MTEVCDSLPDVGVRAVVLDAPEVAADIANRDSTSIEAVDGLTSSSPAYIFYTSGSTGEPKGVVGTQGGMVNRLACAQSVRPWKADEVGCSKASLGFGESTSEILSPLLHGAAVVVADGQQVRDAEALARLLTSGGVGRITLVPSLLDVLLES